MRNERIIMGMPIRIDIALKTDDTKEAAEKAIGKAFSYFKSVDERFSTYKPDSEISRINRHELAETDSSTDMKEIMALAQQTKNDTGGYFDILNREGILDPSGIVKGWAIRNAAKLISRAGFKDFFVDAGGDIQTSGMNEKGEPWTVGIRNPFKQEEIVKKVLLQDAAIATSGTYIRGQHIYDPKERGRLITDIVSLSVVGPDIYEADRFATAAFAMGKDGISFIEKLSGYEGYMIDKDGIATMTSGFEDYVAR